MTDVVQVRAVVPVLVCDPDLIGWTYRGAEMVAVPAARLDERFQVS